MGGSHTLGEAELGVVDGRGSDGVVFYSGAVASGLHKGRDEHLEEEERHVQGKYPQEEPASARRGHDAMLKEGKHARRRLGCGRRDGHHACQDSRSTLRRCEEDVLVRSTT